MPSKAYRVGSFRFVSAAALSLILLWLTVSLPYNLPFRTGIPAQTVQAGSHAFPPTHGGDHNPWNDMTEERAAEGSNSVNEEFLHVHHAGTEPGCVDRNRYLSDRGERPCISYHGELLVPPPNAL